VQAQRAEVTGTDRKILSFPLGCIAIEQAESFHRGLLRESVLLELQFPGSLPSNSERNYSFCIKSADIL